jgi:hypothetical protein
MTASPEIHGVRRFVGRVVSLRQGDGAIALLMFAYSFLAMASYNILKPLTRSKFISDLGSDNLPYVLLASAVVIGLLMHWYTTAARRLARRHVIPATQAAIMVLLVVFSLLLRTSAEWVTVAFYLFGQILGVLLISQFWTLANDVYDARQAKRLFGFIGAGASLGGAAGAALVTIIVDRVGTPDLLLMSAVTLGGCLAIVVTIDRRHPISTGPQVADEAGVGGREAIQLLLHSRHFRIVALAVDVRCRRGHDRGTAAEHGGRGAPRGRHCHRRVPRADRLLHLDLWFILQVVATSRIHRSLGLAFALVLLPVALGSMATVILLTGAFWAPQAARVLDSTLRYTVDKTSREVLFLPLPAELKYRAKPFIDVTMDRFAKGVTAVVMLVLIQPWGLGLDWRRLSYASIGRHGAVDRDRAGRPAAVPQRVPPESRFAHTRGRLGPDRRRRSSNHRGAVEELSNPDPATGAVCDRHAGDAGQAEAHFAAAAASRVAAGARRALRSLSAVRSHIALRWRPAVERLVHDPDVGVRAAALRALAEFSHEDAASLLRRHLSDPEPQVR